MVDIIFSKGSFEISAVEIEHRGIGGVEGQHMDVAWGDLDSLGKELVDGHEVVGVPTRNRAALRGCDKELKSDKTSTKNLKLNGNNSRKKN